MTYPAVRCGKVELSKEDKKAYGKEENKWQAESDVHYLAETKKIKADKVRMNRALYCAKQKAKEAKDIANQLK